MNLYEVKAQFTQRTPNDTIACVKEINIIEAHTFGEAEQIAIDRLTPISFNGHVDVTAMKIVKAFDLVKTDDAESIFKCKVEMNIVDGDCESKSRIVIYVGASTLEEARRNLADFLKEYADAKPICVEETRVAAIWCKE